MIVATETKAALSHLNVVWVSLRCPLQRTMASSCIMETTTTLPWNSSKVTSRSATTLAVSLAMPFTGTPEDTPVEHRVMIFNP